MTSSSSSSSSGLNNTYNIIGLVLAISSGFFIGTSFIIKKKGLLASNRKYNQVAGVGHEYLKSPLWWSGMIMMILGELFNFAAYAFTAAIIVTPLGALSVAISAVLSSFLLKERLNTQGKIGSALCIVGAIIMVLHAPAESTVKNIDSFLNLVIQPPFLVYVGLVIISTAVLVFFMAPRYGHTHMLVYLMICSIVGSVAVAFTQGLGAAIVYSITTENQFTHWFTYVTMVIMAVTQLIEINYLNKALNLFNTAMVTPVYYVAFTTCTIVASIVLFQGFNASGADIATVVMGFFVIISGVVLLQLSRGSADPAEIAIPDTTALLVDEAQMTEMMKDDEDGDATMTGASRRRHRRRTAQDLQRANTLYQDFEVGALAMRANPFETLFRSRLIAKELAYEHRVQQEEEKDVVRRHTIIGHVGIAQDHSADISAAKRNAGGRYGMTLGMVGLNGANETDGVERVKTMGAKEERWHKVRTMFEPRRQQSLEGEGRNGEMSELASLEISRPNLAMMREDSREVDEATLVEHRRVGGSGEEERRGKREM